MSEKPGSGWEEISKLGAVFGLFFFVQAYGYSVGAVPEPVPGKLDISLIAAAALGAHHLSNLVLPFSGVAWPLGPTLCGLLLLYTVFLPEQIRAGPEDARVRQALTYFVFMLAILSLTTIAGATLIRVDGVAEWWRGIPFIRVLEPIGYAGLWVVLWVFLRRVLERPVAQLLSCFWQSRPWPEMAMAVCVAWLMMLAFLSSEFDGRLDRLSQMIAR